MAKNTTICGAHDDAITIIEKVIKEMDRLRDADEAMAYISDATYELGRAVDFIAEAKEMGQNMEDWLKRRKKALEKIIDIAEDGK